MVANILLFLWVAFILAFGAFVIRKYFSNSSSYIFQEYEKSDLPFITIDVNGKQLNMIADSGASVSIIRRDSIEDIPVEPSTRKVNLSALTSEGLDSEVVTIPFTINGKEIKSDFVVYNSHDIAGFSRHGIRIDGILGVEFFKKTKGKVDFEKQSVIFP